MSEMELTNPDSVETDWRVVSAEYRVNAIRISAIAVFYLVHLWHVSAPRLGEQAASIIGFDPESPVSSSVHLGITVLCLGWLMHAFAVHFLIHRRQVSDRTVLLSTLGDVGWLTAILCLSTGPRGPLVVGFFLIIMLTGLRFNLRLVRFTTLAAVIGYLIVLGVAKWPVATLKNEGLESVPRYHQMMIILALVFSGVIMGQIVRHGYVIANTLHRRQEESP